LFAIYKEYVTGTGNCINIGCMCVQKSLQGTFPVAFSSRCAKTGTSSFRKVVWKILKVWWEVLYGVLLEIYFSFQQWKHF